ncbi:hypothetical protein DERF_004635 [Dermatophagoides farinae]|uniref:Uncharacterized protein n=1 Tax=Dermatophagoides farinae TaxID=6954 RepID=A0A922LAB7_DERFA|nr:hypothetical protein DERF_004635 [Dermatophagoides farinae]
MKPFLCYINQLVPLLLNIFMSTIFLTVITLKMGKKGIGSLTKNYDRSSSWTIKHRFLFGAFVFSKKRIDNS